MVGEGDEQRQKKEKKKKKRKKKRQQKRKKETRQSLSGVSRFLRGRCLAMIVGREKNSAYRDDATLTRNK